MPPRSVSLDIRDLESNLKQRSIHGGMYSFLSHFSIYALRIVFSAVMARLLLPKDYGLVGMVTALTNFADQFRSLGLSQATIQKRNLTQEQISAMFWINMIVGAILSLIVAASGPVMAWFYKEPALTGIAVASSFSFVLSGINVQHTALLQRQMLMGRLAYVEVISFAGSSAMGVAAAFAGMGYWALVILNLAHPAIRSILLWHVTGWRPSWVLRGAGIRGMLAFGAGVSGFNIVNYFSRNLDKVIIGRTVGKEPLGYYSKAYTLLLLPITQIRTPLINVGIPALAALQNDPERYRRYYEKILSAISFLSMPVVAWMIVSAPDIIRVLLGERWLPAAELFAILGIVAFIQAPLTAARGLPILSTGQGNKYFLFGVVTAVITVCGFIAGSPWGVRGVAWGYVAATYITIPPTSAWCLRGSPVRPWNAWRATWPSALLSGLVGLAVWAIRLGIHLYWPEGSLVSAIASLAATGLALAVIMGAAIGIFPGLRREIAALLFRKKRPSSAALHTAKNP